MNRPAVRVAAAAVVLALIGGLVFALRSRPAPVVVPTPRSTIVPLPPRLPYTPVPADTIAPVVVQRTPARGEELPPGSPIELVFDRAMDKPAVEAAFSVAPAVPGAIEWADARTLRFRPSQPLPRAQVFDVALSQGAKAADGAALREPLQFRFSTAGFLEVGQVIPADGATEVQPDATITVLFNRPVVPLLVAEQQATLPQPLSFTPALAGRGEWLNTAVYVFHPDAPLAGGTTYTAQIAAGLQGIDGSPLQSAYTWKFSTARPQVLSVVPQDTERLVAIERTISVQLNQPIDPASTQSAFHLHSSNGDTPGALQVIRDTILFTPSARLAFDTDYQVVLDAGLGSAAGGNGLASEFRSSFRTVPLPQLLGTLPADGDTAAQPYTDLTLFFNAPIDLATVLPNLQMTPPLSPTQVYTYGTLIYPGDTSVPAGAGYAFHISFGAQPSRDYAAQIGPNIADPYGNRIGQGRAIRFRTAPLPPAVQIVMPDYLATYRAGGVARVGISSVNSPSASLALYRLALDDLRNPYRDPSQLPPDSALLRRWQVPLNTPLDKPTLSMVNLLENNGALDPGVYLLTLDQGAAAPQQHIMVVSNINVTLKTAPKEALLWANDLQTGAPVSGLDFELFDDQGNALGRATTDTNGVARVQHDRNQNQGILAIARQPFAAASSNWARGISPWEFGIENTSFLPSLAMHVYTDRPLYRPGQAVYFKGVVRAERDVSFSLPAATVANVMINNVNGEQIFQQTLPLSANGTFSGSLTLVDSAALGGYSINVSVGDQSLSFPFTVAAYRAPEFAVNVRAPAEVVRGAPVAATAEVRYFFGGPVANALVQWNVLANSYRFSPVWGGRYQFGDTDDPWRCWECWWQPAAPPQPILNGSGTTDAQGNLTITLPAELKDAQGVPITDSVQLTIEASATGRDNQMISGRTNIVSHRGSLYLGLAPRSYVAQAGEAQQVDLVASDTAGQRQPNQTIDVELVRYSWDNKFIADANGGGHWEWREARTPAGNQQVTTDAKGEAVASFTPPEAGSYRLVARGRDSGGRVVQSSIFVWVAGDGYAPWRRDNNDQISLISDKTSYTPGETAEVLIPSPFTQPHWALITVERGGILSHEVRKLEGNSSVFRLPITNAHVPNVYVSVTLFSPPDAPGRPADYKVGVLPLAVAPDPQTLRVTATPDHAPAQPGETVRYTINVADTQGRPVAAELSLDLVDQAVLSLMPRIPDAIGAAFYSRRPLAIATASGLSISGDRFLRQFEQDLERQQRERQQAPPTSLPTTAADTAGGAAAGAVPAAAPTAAPAATSAPAALESSAKNAAQGSTPTVREQFADTAYWNATITTDVNGSASVDIALPDNLTTWVLRGVALTADTRVGEGTTDLLVTKPMLVRPVMPRFLTVGDTVELAANVSNNTASPLTTQVGLTARGITVTGELTQTLTIPANGEAQATWRASVPDVTAADLVFSAVAGSYADAARPRLGTGPGGTLPVYRYSAPEIVGTGGQLDADGTRTEAIGLPPNIDPRNGELTVRLDPSLAAGLRDGLKALDNPDYESTEALVSSFLPNILTLRALKQLGAANPELEAQLPNLVEAALNKLASQQHNDGGWGWWSLAADGRTVESNPHISAYVVFGLQRAKEAGFSVRDDVLTRGLDYLTTQLLPTGQRPDQLASADANRQAWLLYVLADAGRADTARLDDLYANRTKLGVYARGFLALALNRAGATAGDARIKTLLADFNSSAIMSATGAHWEERERDWWSMNTDTRTTAIVLLALTRLDAQNQLNPNIVRWLMVARNDGVWESTQETAWSLMALTDWMVATGELKADYDYGVWLNNAAQASGHITPADAQTPIVLRVRVAQLLQDAGNRLTIGRGAGSGRLYYTAHLRAFLPVEQIQALDRGVTVRRRYTLASCQDGPKCPAVSEVKVGDVIRVELEIIAPNDLYYLQVEDPLPAGAEAIDTTLATTSVLAPPPELQQPVPIEGPVAPAAEARVAPPIDVWWGWWRWYSRSELRDEKVVLFADYLARGAYLYSYTMRATQAGEFRVIPTTAHEQYFPEVYGRADGQLLRIAAK
jgi:uncharacterized protein YfaS (alpha-2-macroglobulin family)